MPKRPIEREFGVPIAGEILPPEQWTQTALKRLPAAGRLDWQSLFGRPGELVLDIGCGNGRFLIGSSVWRPEYNHVGIDILPVVIRYATRRANQRGLANIRFAVCDGFRFLERLVEPGGVSEIHCYHPQPPGYWRYIREAVCCFFSFEEHPKPWEDAPKGRTRREIIALRRGLPVFRGHGVAREDAHDDDALRSARELPAPAVDADHWPEEMDE